jgi:HPt (histidine-containing phosphotransfer) domain-containing protein
MNDTVQFDESVYQILRSELGEEDAVEVLKTFLEDTASKLPKIALKVEDRAEMRREAHSIKSSAATFGFSALSRLARELEAGAASMDIAQMREFVEKLQQAFEAVARFSETNLLTSGATAV